MIQLNAVSKTFRIAPGPGRRAGVIEAIRALTTIVDAGVITGVVGPNGAGKTTLFGLLLGFLEPTAGAVAIDGRAPRRYVREFGASYLPERFQLPRDWKLRDGLRMLTALDRVTTPIDELLERFDLSGYADARAHTLSRGTMQRVGLAQAVASARNLVVFDEPTEGLDPIWRVRFRELVGELRAPERSVLIASHDLAEIERLADRVIILRDGAISESIDLREHVRVHEYTIVLAAPHAALATIFPGARASGDAIFTITVSSPADLNARLAALIEAGATVVSLNPAADLEARIVRGPAERL